MRIMVFIREELRYISVKQRIFVFYSKDIRKSIFENFEKQVYRNSQ